MSKNDTRLAFPCQPMGMDGLPSTEAHTGMTLRDYFAAKCISGVLPGDQATPRDTIAKWAYAMADAMLAARDES